TRIGFFPARSTVFQRYSDFERRVLMPQTVWVSGWPRARMLKSITWWVPGQEPVERAVQPGGVKVGKTPIIGRCAPASKSRFRFGAWPQAIIFLTSSMLAPSIPITIARFAGLPTNFSSLLPFGLAGGGHRIATISTASTPDTVLRCLDTVLIDRLHSDVLWSNGRPWRSNR